MDVFVGEIVLNFIWITPNYGQSKKALYSGASMAHYPQVPQERIFAQIAN
jgi:hypothetical protein